MLLHDGRSWNASAKKRNLLNSTNVAVKDLVSNGSTLKRWKQSNCNVLCHDFNNICFSYEGKAYKIKFRFGLYALQDPPLFSSTEGMSKTAKYITAETVYFLLFRNSSIKYHQRSLFTLSDFFFGKYQSHY